MASGPVFETTLSSVSIPASYVTSTSTSEVVMIKLTANYMNLGSTEYRNKASSLLSFLQDAKSTEVTPSLSVLKQKLAEISGLAPTTEFYEQALVFSMHPRGKIGLKAITEARVQELVASLPADVKSGEDVVFENGTTLRFPVAIQTDATAASSTSFIAVYSITLVRDNQIPQSSPV
jgi:hypothetical protein